MRGRDPNRIDALLNLVHRCRELGATPMANGAVLEEEDGPEDCEGYYWRHVGETIGRPYMLLSDFLELEHGGPGRTIEILGLGSGSCNQTFNLARTLDSEYRIRCINDDKAAVDAARRRDETEGLNVELEEADLNTIKIDPGRYHLILAHAILCDVIELEHLLEQIFNGLHASGFLQVVDIVGKDRVLLWEENEQLVNSLLADLPDAVTSGQRVEVGLSEGPHGLRLDSIAKFQERTHS